VAGLVALYTAHRDEAGRETEREAPIVAPSRVRAADGGPVVALDSAESRRIGLATAVLASTSGAPPLRLAGQVVEEPERVAAVRAPLPGLLSAPEGGRWPALGERLEAGSVIGRVSDARPLALSMGGTVTRIGARPGEIVAAGQLLLEVVDRSRPTIRVVWDPSGGEPPRRLTVEPPGAARRVQARLIGPAPEADALTRRPAFLYRAERSWPGGTPGTPVSALAPSAAPAARGALVPEAAVVQWDGLTWAYRQRGPGTFERVAVGTDRAVPGGWIATRGLVPGDTVVVAGAQELISEEFRARVGVGDESGE
jgi:hypothetical protein